MKTAEEILSKVSGHSNDSGGIYDYDSLISAINEARKEAIEECAERVKIIRYQENQFANYESALGNVQRDQVDKQSILLLIKELK